MRTKLIFCILAGTVMIGIITWWVVENGILMRSSLVKSLLSERPVFLTNTIKSVVTNMTVVGLSTKPVQSINAITGVQLVVTSSSPDLSQRETLIAYNHRLNVVRGLSKDISEDDLNTLGKYLRTPIQVRPDLLESEYWLRNDIMDKLVEQNLLTPETAQLMIGISKDPQQFATMRDYAIQHLQPLYKKLDTNSQTLIRSVLWQATDETTNSIAGTAMFALLKIMGKTVNSVVKDDTKTSPNTITAIERTRLEQTALRIALDSTSGQLARTAAISVCGRLKVKESLPLAVELAQSSTIYPMRLAAIATLGEIGGIDVLGTLRYIADGPDQRLKLSALSAIYKVQARLGI